MDRVQVKKNAKAVDPQNLYPLTTRPMRRSDPAGSEPDPPAPSGLPRPADARRGPKRPEEARKKIVPPIPQTTVPPIPKR